jgi:hypothetical protein
MGINTDSFVYRTTEYSFNQLEPNFSKFFLDKLTKEKLSYRMLSKQGQDTEIIKIIELLKNKELVRAGRDREGQWKDGWAENLEEFKQTKNIESLVPKYFGKIPIVRLNQKFIQPITDNFEYKMLCLLQYWLFDKYLRDVDHIYEFGCGTGHNLLRAAEINPTAILGGFDWAESSQEILSLLYKQYANVRHWGRLDFFEPDYNIQIEKNSAVYTVAALEQVGDKHHEFIQFLLDKKPSICLHIEPIAELLEPDSNVLDYLSVQYFKKRNYLNGFLDSLHRLREEGKIEILREQRSGIGSYFIDGYSVVVWRPV